MMDGIEIWDEGMEGLIYILETHLAGRKYRSVSPSNGLEMISAYTTVAHTL